MTTDNSFNKSSNNSVPCFVETSIPGVVGYVIILMTSVIGNSLVVAIMAKNKLTKKNPHLLFFNMVISDFLLSVVYIPRMVVMMVYGDIWIIGGELGLMLCRIIPFLHHVTIKVSVLTIMLVTVDRFLVVVFPLKNILKLKMVKVVIVIAWFIAIIFQSPYLLTAVLVPVAGGSSTCSVRFSLLLGQTGTQVYYKLMLWWYCITLVIIIILSVLAVVKLKKSKEIGVNNDIALARKQKASEKLLKLVFIVTGCFICCWSMYFFTDIFIDRPFPCIIYFFRFFLAHTNSAFNPCILLVTNQEYRNGFKAIFTRRSHQVQHARSSSHSVPGLIYRNNSNNKNDINRSLLQK